MRNKRVFRKLLIYQLNENERKRIMEPYVCDKLICVITIE